MKKLFILLAILTLPLAALAKNTRTKASDDHPYDDITIISDLDDTIKITHVGDTSDMIVNGLFKEKYFAGVPEFYRSIVSPRQTFYVVSGSGEYLRKRIEDALEDNKMPKTEVILKNKGDGKTYDYKVKKIRGIIGATAGNFILLGDDTEFDPQVLLTIKNEFPDRVIGTYIRSVRGKKFEAPIKSYLTVYEVANYEIEAKRLDKAALPEIEAAILSSKEKLLIPPFVSCALLPALKTKMSAAVAQRVSDICKKN